ncbi:MAG: RNA polymerase sporulation sigma factor SigK [Ruminococcus sp.]|nr:RNA polymerase sporulation sigma factor SigK [Ruminococcus sp.]
MLMTLLGLLQELPLLFALHFADAEAFPRPLSAKEERECFEKMREGDREARDKLIKHNLRLVAHIAKKYSAAAVDREDLISIGTVGLIKAVSTFDHSKGTRFATYGSRCVENELLMHFRWLRKTALEVHLEEPVESDKDGNSLCLMDLISDGEDLEDKTELMVRSGKLYKAVMKCLTERERQVMVMRYGLFGGKPLTQREACKHLGISRSYVSRIEKKALEKLREEMGGRELAE